MSSQATFIDVWDVETFDPALLEELREHQQHIKAHFDTETAIFAVRETSGLHTIIPANEHNEWFLQFTKRLAGLAATRHIRAWHYTRLSAHEVETLQVDGIHISTLETLRRRLDAQVACGSLNYDIAAKIYADCPLQSDQRRIRSNKFWMISYPRRTYWGGVKPLLACWGGESAYWFHKDTESEIHTLLFKKGMPRVLELSVPLWATEHAHSGANAIVATFGRTLGCKPDRSAFDLYVTQPLEASSIINVHSEGEAAFNALGQGYPARFPLAGDEDFSSPRLPECRLPYA